MATALSADQENPLDILVINGASAALTISDIPFGGPIGASRVGYVDGDFVINPTYEDLDRSSLDLVVAGTSEGVLMMEAGASELSDDLMLEAIQLGQSANQEMIALQLEMAQSSGAPRRTSSPQAFRMAYSIKWRRRPGTISGRLSRRATARRTRRPASAPSSRT